MNTNESVPKPVELHSSAKAKIINSLSGTNRITIVVGGTGSGKSTLIPQLLLESIGHPILCTQPRRLAVVAVSDHVAKQRNCTLGSEVGYHVGQSRIATHKTKLLFATAGILLEDLKANGLEAICKYKVVVIDECHERSAESDLCLVIIKAFMVRYPQATIKIILMSATFNQGKYVSYFDGVPGCDYINTITLETGASIDAYYKNVTTHYMEDILQKIPSDTRRKHLQKFERLLRLDPDAEMHGIDGGKSLSVNMLIVISTLVFVLHQEEPAGAKFLIFAPTYRHLEQIHSLLTELSFGESSSPVVDVLHSSVDIEDCLAKMQSTRDPDEPKNRHILLASAIADSSVTIPGVTCVIDSCRALEVKWDSQRETYIPKTMWASKSICDQRKGRTGRTCPGRVFRLVNQSFYINRLDNWDQPQIELASCRDEMLALLSSTNKVFSDPQGLLKRCLDPPPEISVTKAINYLRRVGACEIKKAGQKVTLVPTELGRLLAALPYTISEGNIIVRGAKSGMLHEALVIVSILSTRPYPILHIFGDSDANEATQKMFYADMNPKDPKSVIIANVAAYLFWCLNWKKNIMQRKAKSRFLHCTNSYYYGLPDYSYDCFNLYPNEINDEDKIAHDCNIWIWSNELDHSHSAFCKKYFINPTSVKAIDANINVAMNILYHKEHEPIWLKSQTPSSVWNREFGSTIKLGQNVFEIVYGTANSICQKLMELQDASLEPCNQFESNGDSDSDSEYETTACIHFLNGNCTFGERCRHAHSYTAPRPICRFFLNGGCTNASCLYAHKRNRTTNANATTHLTNSYTMPNHGGALGWFERNADHLLLLGEGDFSFTRALVLKNIHPSIATTDSSKSPSISVCKTLSGIDATRCHTNNALKTLCDSITACAWNFPYTGLDEDDEIHKSLLSGTFMSISIFLETNMTNCHDKHAEFALTLQGDQLTRWNVLQSAERAGFYLYWWDDFDHSQYPGYTPKRSNGERFPAQHTRFYVFRLSRC